MKKIIIAIDGEASTGKTTLAKRLSNYYKYQHIDSGAMYRAVTYFALEKCTNLSGAIDYAQLIKYLPEIRINFKIINSQQLCYLNGVQIEDQIRNMEVSDFVSEVSEIREVRVSLVDQQRAMGQKKGIVMEGRDIGTIVFPEAECKFFLMATAEVRAQRRFEQLSNFDKKIKYKDILSNVIKRDRIDQTREHSPLVKAKDAIIIDVSTQTINQLFRTMKERICEKLKMSDS